MLIIIAALVAGGICYVNKNWNPVSENPLEKPPATKEITRDEVIKDVSERINEISPVEPVLGGKWYVLRFWFIQDSNKDFYVEYEDGHIMRQILAKTDQGLNHEIIGVFEPGEVDWELKQGEDKFFGSLLDLYEYNEELEAWIKKN
jgi:hypothetical protein